ncbi:MAG: thioredoxin domain-containing protein [Terriglobales bacterium]
MQRTLISCLLFLALITASRAQQTTAGKPARSESSHSTTTGTHGREARLPSEETVNAFLHETFGYNPDLSWKVSDIKPSEAEGLAEVVVVITTPQGLQTNQFYVTEDGKHAITGDIIPFGSHPFAAARIKLEKEASGVARGPARAPVTIVEFGDLQCPHCKEAQPEIERLLSEEKDTKLIFQNFPLQSHDWAEKGADYADCVGHSSNAAFWKFIQSVYDAQSDITAANADDKLKALADAAGVDGTKIAACAAETATAGRVERSVELGNSLDVTGTPTLFINGRSISNLGNLPYAVLKQLVEFAAQEGSKAESTAK